MELVKSIREWQKQQFVIRSETATRIGIMSVMTTQANEIAKNNELPKLPYLPAAKLWRSSAPEQIVSSWKKGTPQDSWPILRNYFSKRKSHRAIASLFDGKRTPVTWAIPNRHDAFLEWHKSLNKHATQKESSNRLKEFLSTWLETASLKPITVNFALEALSWTYCLPRLSADLDFESWWKLADALITIAEESEGCRVDEESSADDLLFCELISGELPLALAVMLPELKSTKSLSESARKRLSQSLIELTDGEGLLKAELLGVSELLLASWTRCKTIGEATGKGAFSSDANTQYEWLIQQTLRLSDRNGRMPFVEEAPNEALQLMQYAVEMWGDSEDEVAASKRLKGFKAKRYDDDQPEPSGDSEWACLATLSAGWSDKSPRFTIDYSDQTLRIELVFESRVLISGDWPIEVTRGGQQLKAQDAWEVNCWYSDEDCDYLELSMDLHDGSKLERMVMLAREDGVAMLGEILLGPAGCDSSSVSINSKLPLANGVSLKEEAETRDVTLLAKEKPACGIMPLALPEWKVERRVGELGVIDNHLVFSAKTEGRNLASPIWIDFSKTRYAKQRTWRQLTVGQSLNRVSDDVAVSYRVQSGKEQWLIYRSLDERANRTVLGQNLASEALYGKFLKTGEVDEYLEISGDGE